MNQFIFLDRDGVINQDSLHYIKSVQEFVPIPGSIDAIARLSAAGYKIGIATNQSGVSRGHYTEVELKAIHNKLLHLVESAGGEIAAIEYCIHLPDAGCPCRKPQPGMLYALADRLNCSLSEVSFVGDRISDIRAAEAAGAKPVMIISTMTELVHLSTYPHVPQYNSLASYVDFLLGKQ